MAVCWFFCLFLVIIGYFLIINNISMRNVVFLHSALICIIFLKNVLMSVGLLLNPKSGS